jgi:hypothetical protein
MKLSGMKIMQKKAFIRKKINPHDPGGHERCKDSITIKNSISFCESGRRINRTYGVLLSGY